MTTIFDPTDNEPIQPPQYCFSCGELLKVGDIYFSDTRCYQCRLPDLMEIIDGD